MDTFALGDSIFGLSNLWAPSPDQAGLQQYAVLNVRASALTPSGFSHDQVVTLPVNLTTAWIALFGEAGLGLRSPFSSKDGAGDAAPQTVIVLGAGASNGKFAVQLASLAGVRNIIAVAGSSSKDDLLSMGATRVVDRQLSIDDIAKEIRGLVGEQDATHIYHCHGFDYKLDIALLPTETKSFLQSVHPVDDEEGEKLKAARPLCEAAMVEGSNVGLAPYVDEFWAAVPKWLSKGKVRPGSYRVIEGLEKVDEINDGLDGYRDGGKGAQFVVHV